MSGGVSYLLLFLGRSLASCLAAIARKSIPISSLLTNCGTLRSSEI